MEVHIGQIIRDLLKSKGVLLKKFGDYMGMSDRNVQHFLNRNDIPATQLKRASEFLHEDLTKYFKPENVSDSFSDIEGSYTARRNWINVSLNVAADMKTMSLFPELLREFNEVANKHGFKIG